MIELGERVAVRSLEGTNSSAVGKGDLIGQAIPLLADLGLRGTQVGSTLHPLLSQIDSLPDFVDGQHIQGDLRYVQIGLARKFSREDRVLTSKNFSPVPVFSRGVLKYFAVTLIDPEPLGPNVSWNQLMAKDDQTNNIFNLEVDGQDRDTRKGTDLDVIRAMTIRALATYRDSRPKGKASPSVNNPQRSYTWLTGSAELAQTYGAPCAYDDILNSDLQLRSPAGKWPTVGFRPTVKIAV